MMKVFFDTCPISKLAAGKELIYIMNQEQRLKEINEAINAGNQAIYSLENASALLSSAGNWGLWDMFGGGFLTSMIKHSKMDNAKAEMEQAKIHLKNFQRELSDIDVPTDFQLEVSGFLTFADYFFDGIVADYLVQSKINDAKAQVKQGLHTVSSILHDLNLWKSQILLEGDIN